MAFVWQRVIEKLIVTLSHWLKAVSNSECRTNGAWCVILHIECIICRAEKMFENLICQYSLHHCSISTERHRAEIRRAVNDEKFATVAEHLAGSNTSAEWAIEGRRLVPLLPRLVPQTVFTIAANQAATMAQTHNMTLPSPSETSRKEG